MAIENKLPFDTFVITISGNGNVLHKETVPADVPNYFDVMMRLKNHVEEIGKLDAVDEFHLKWNKV